MKCPYCKQELVDLDEQNVNDKVSAYCCIECDMIIGIGPAFSK